MNDANHPNNPNLWRGESWVHMEARKLSLFRRRPSIATWDPVGPNFFLSNGGKRHRTSAGPIPDPVFSKSAERPQKQTNLGRVPTPPRRQGPAEKTHSDDPRCSAVDPSKKTAEALDLVPAASEVLDGANVRTKLLRLRNRSTPPTWSCAMPRQPRS